MLSFVAGLSLGLLGLVVVRVRAMRPLRELAAGTETSRARAIEAAERERVLRAALDGAPSAIVLFSDVGRIALANEAARELFFEGRDLQGENFVAMLGTAPDALRRALSHDGGELFSVVDPEGERQTYHLSKRRFAVGEEHMVLVVVENLSHEIGRQEADAWKRMIRLFCHELNNSLAPVSSLVHTARLVVEGAPVAPKLERIFATIADRTEHLRSFLEGYAQFARLPAPRKADVAWKPFVDRLLQLWPAARLEDELPAEPGWFDAAQIEQVAINLLKNASEAGGPADQITLAVTSLGARGVQLTVADRGPGMSVEILERALVPFYSTKERGTGLGLTLCREIVDSHGGAMRLVNREGGGLEVQVRLLARDAAPASAGKLTLTRS